MADKIDYIARRRESDGEIHYLWNHLEEVARMTGKFAAKIGLQRQGELIGILHDLGKMSETFQLCIKSATGLIDEEDDDYVDAAGKKGYIDHSTAGAQLLSLFFTGKDKENVLVEQFLSLCLVSHHSRLGIIDCIAPDGKDIFSKRMKKDDNRTHTKEVESKLCFEQRARIKELVCDKNIVTGVIDTLKMLHEKGKDSKETLAFKFGLLIRFLYSCLIDADRLSAADFEYPMIKKMRNNGKYVPWDILISRLNVRLRDFKPDNEINKLRAEISAQCFEFSDKPKGIYKLTVPTGGGKTLSSLRFALNHAAKHGLDRIIYVLPYTSIIDQNAEEVRGILEEKDKDGNYKGNIVLEHHSNLTPEEETFRRKILAEDWDAPIVFTTMVQVLEAFFGSGTQSVRRLHQMANAVIIFDEVQAIPVKCVYMFNAAVRFLTNNCGSTVVLCTATQPLLDKVTPKERALDFFESFQIVPDTSIIFERLKRFDVFERRKSGGWSTEEIKSLVAGELEKTGSVLVIVNTKNIARDIFQKCKGVCETVHHLSTYMCPAHRAEKFKEIKFFLDEKKPIVCVSTSLIEAGVDIDFGAVIRSLAGLDSIAQAAGRCNRHKKRPCHGRVTIINPANENIENLKDIRIGRDIAERVLDECKKCPADFDAEVLGLKAMERYYQYYFYNRTNEMNYPVNSKSAVRRNDNLFSLFSTNVLSVKAYERINRKSPSIPFQQAFASAAKIFQAIDSPTRGLVVPYGKEGKQIINELCSAYEVEKQYKLIKAAQRYSVNIFDSDRKKIAQAIHEVQTGAGIFYLDERYYSDDYGISEESVNDMPLLNG